MRIHSGSLFGGSSPRTWGTLMADNGLIYGIRFIPTYMGNATKPIINGSLLTVHPHVHGER